MNRGLTARRCRTKYLKKELETLRKAVTTNKGDSWTMTKKTDIVEKLRVLDTMEYQTGWSKSTLEEAAEEIERLRNSLSRYQAIHYLNEVLFEVEDERDKLRQELYEAIKMFGDTK